jgi:hypothetical protein
MPEGPLLHCAYCGERIRFVGAEQAETFIRHYYSCPHCGRIWTMSPAGHLEASATALGDPAAAAGVAGPGTPPAAEADPAEGRPKR